MQDVSVLASRRFCLFCFAYKKRLLEHVDEARIRRRYKPAFDPERLSRP